MPQGGDVILSPNPKTRQRRGAVPENLINGQVIGEAIRAFVDYQRNEAKRRLDDVIKGIGSGLVDPDDALVQGTQGGTDYEKVFGVRPPERPRYDPVDITRSELVTDPKRLMVPEAGDISHDPYVEFKTDKMYRKTGGFQPNDVNSLQRFVIKSIMRNEPVSREAVAASGLLKTRAQENMYDPSIQQDFLKIQNEPRLMNEFVKYRIAYPDKADRDIIADLKASFPSSFSKTDPSKVSDTTPGKNIRQTVAEIKATTAKDIADQRNQTYSATWDKRLENSRNLRKATIEATDRRTGVIRDRALSQDYRQLATHLSHDVGWENAFAIAHEMIYGEGDMSNFEALKPTIDRALKQKQRLMDAKIKNIESMPDARKSAMEARTTRLNQYADALQMQLDKMEQLGHKDEVGRIRSQIQALNNMGRVDPSRKQEAAEALARLLENEFGFVRDSDPQGVYETIMNWFTGGPSNRIVPGQAPSPDTQPKPAPKSGIVPTRPQATPRGTTSDQFLERYRKSKSEGKP